MGTCEVCGNEYGHTFTVRMNGKSHEFDAFECAINALAPTCDACGCRVIGHGVEHADAIFCSAHCARTRGIAGLSDHV
ncbi:MAG: hypothetical protein PVG21_07760 [Gammaproteobacteria bacterium]|jgi:hypothetical protein